MSKKTLRKSIAARRSQDHITQASGFSGGVGWEGTRANAAKHEPHSYRGGKWPVLTTRRIRRYQAKMRAKGEARNEKKESVCTGASSSNVAP